MENQGRHQEPQAEEHQQENRREAGHRADRASWKPLLLPLFRTQSLLRLGFHLWHFWHLRVFHRSRFFANFSFHGGELCPTFRQIGKRFSGNFFGHYLFPLRLAARALTRFFLAAARCFRVAIEITYALLYDRLSGQRHAFWL